MPNPYNSSEYTQAFAITPSAVKPVQGPKQANGTNLGYCRAFIASTAGNVTAILKDDRGDGTQVTFAVLAGTFYPLSLSFVISSTATLIGLV